MKPRKLLIVLVGSGLVAAFIAMMLTVAYPNSLKVAAPYLCPDDMPDAFVVRYEVQTSDGQGINFTLFCMSERGEFEEVGTWRPLLVLVIAVAAVFFGLMFLQIVHVGVRRLFGGGSDPPTGPTEPVIDDPVPTEGDDPFAAIRDQQGPIIS